MHNPQHHQLALADWLVHIARAPQNAQHGIVSPTLDTAEHNVLRPIGALTNPAAAALNRSNRVATVLGRRVLVFVERDLHLLDEAMRGLTLHSAWVDPALPTESPLRSTVLWRVDQGHDIRESRVFPR